jgi:hypothetical protein
MVTFKRTGNKANRGKPTEDAVAKALATWQGQRMDREFNRLVDSKAAGRIIKAAAADFEFFIGELEQTHHGLIEAKETEHEFRIARPKITQLPALRRRRLAGGRCYVVIYHSTIRKYRSVSGHWLDTNGDKGSWNLERIPAFDTPIDALNWASSGLFA